MPLDRYRRVLARPGVARLLIFAVLARVPSTGSGVALTLHIVLTLHRGYAAAGLVATTATVGMAIGGPWRGRAVDRAGLRRSLVPSVVVSTLAWSLAPFAGYPELLVLAFAGGLLGVLVFTVVRQSLSVLVPAEQRRTAFSLDGIGTELSFMIGPAVGVLVATEVSTRAALLAVAGATLAVGLALIAVNPPTRSPEPEASPHAEASPHVKGPSDVEGASGVEPATVPALVSRRAWFTPALVAVLATAAGGTVALAGTDVAVVAHLRAHGAVSLTGLVFVAWGTGSMLGGLFYGGLRRDVSPFWLLLGLGLLTVPVGLAGGPFTLLATILPAAVLCAPVIAATAEGISRLVPEAARGEAMGWHGSALQVGSAMGAPLAGVAIDEVGPWAGFAGVGALAALIALTGLLVTRAGRRMIGGIRGQGAAVARL